MSLDFNQLELQRETLFKDAVLTSADAKSMRLIADAQEKSNAMLAQARESCKLADHDLIVAGLQLDAEREYSTAGQQARRELLQHRTQLVDSLFADVEKRLADFAAGKDYGRWLAARAAAHAAQLPQGATVTVYLRQADMVHAAGLQQALPGCTVQPAGDIRLGGVRVSDGRRLFDDTLDARLEDEKQRFTQESGLHV